MVDMVRRDVYVHIEQSFKDSTIKIGCIWANVIDCLFTVTSTYDDFMQTTRGAHLKRKNYDEKTSYAACTKRLINRDY